MFLGEMVASGVATTVLDNRRPLGRVWRPTLMVVLSSRATRRWDLGRSSTSTRCGEARVYRSGQASRAAAGRQSYSRDTREARAPATASTALAAKGGCAQASTRPAPDSGTRTARFKIRWNRTEVSRAALAAKPLIVRTLTAFG